MQCRRLTLFIYSQLDNDHLSITTPILRSHLELQLREWPLKNDHLPTTGTIFYSQRLSLYTSLNIHLYNTFWRPKEKERKKYLFIPDESENIFLKFSCSYWKWIRNYCFRLKGASMGSNVSTGLRYSRTFYLRIRLFTLAKSGQNDYFLVKNGLFICEFKIRGSKWRKVSTANNDGNHVSTFRMHKNAWVKMMRQPCLKWIISRPN